MTLKSTVQLAKEGNVEAIAALINRSLSAQGITAIARLKNHCLEIMLESEHPLAPQALVVYLHKGMTDLNAPAIQSLRVYGKHAKESFPDWQEEVKLGELPSGLATPPKVEIPVSVPSGRRSSPSRLLSLRQPATLRQRTLPKVVPTRSSEFVLFQLPPKGLRILGFAIAIIILQIGGTLGLLIWNKLNRPPVLSQASPQLSDPTGARSPTVLPQKSVYTALIKYKQRGIPVIDVTFNGSQTFEMIVDTGASGTLITQGMANSLQVTPMRTVTLAIADGSLVELPVGEVNSISVDGAAISNVPVVIAPGMSIGLLGHDFFEGFDLKIKKDVVEFYPR